MPIDCDCHPGTVENGWHETRGPRCREADRAAWARFYERSQQCVKDILHTLGKEQPMPIECADCGKRYWSIGAMMLCTCDTLDEHGRKRNEQ